MPERAYRGPEFCKLVNITYRQLDYWDRTNLLSPSTASAQGSGTVRFYSESDLHKGKIIRLLIDEGISMQRIRRIIAAMPEIPTEGFLLVGRSRVEVTNDIDPSKFDEPCLVVPLTYQVCDEPFEAGKTYDSGKTITASYSRVVLD